MTSVQAGLRAREIKKDTYERLHCAECNERLTTHPDPDPETGVSMVVCPSCGKEWRDL